MANLSPTELAMHLTKAAMTTILAQRKAEPWKRDIETKGTDGAFYNRLLPLAGPGKKETRTKKNPDTREQPNKKRVVTNNIAKECKSKTLNSESE